MNNTNSLDKHLLNQIESSNNFFWLKARHRLIITLVKKLEIKNILDIGAGVGGLGIEAVKGGIDYYFSEPDKNSNIYLKNKFGPDKEIILNKNLNTKFENESALVFLDVFEHVENPKKLFNEYSEILQYQDFLIFTVPAYQCLWSNWDIYLGHFRRYNRKSCREFIKILNLEIIEVSYLFPELLIPAIYRKVKNSKQINFPKLPKSINNFLFLISIFISKLRRIIPFGLSVLVVAKKIKN